MKKSASKSITGVPNTELAAASRCASVTELGVSCTPDGASIDERQAGQRLAIDLPRSEPRQLVMGAPDRRDHVLRQLRGERALRRLDIEISAVGHNVSDQHVACRRVLRDRNRRRPHPGLIGNQHLDLAELDAIAADLHLVVDASVKYEPARRDRCSPHHQSGTAPEISWRHWNRRGSE